MTTTTTNYFDLDETTRGKLTRLEAERYARQYALELEAVVPDYRQEDYDETILVKRWQVLINDVPLRVLFKDEVSAEVFAQDADYEATETLYVGNDARPISTDGRPCKRSVRKIMVPSAEAYRKRPKYVRVNEAARCRNDRNADDMAKAEANRDEAEDKVRIDWMECRAVVLEKESIVLAWESLADVFGIFPAWERVRKEYGDSKARDAFRACDRTPPDELTEADLPADQAPVTDDGGPGPDDGVQVDGKVVAP